MNLQHLQAGHKTSCRPGESVIMLYFLHNQWDNHIE